MSIVFRTKVSLLISGGIISCTLFANLGFAQKDIWRHNELKLTGNYQYYFNKQNVDMDGKGFEPINAKNVGTYNCGVEYMRIFKYGITLSAGIRYGVEKHNINLFTSFANIDPEATEKLKNASYSFDINVRSAFLSPKLMIGYRKKIGNLWDIDFKYGLSVIKYKKDDYHQEQRELTYALDNSTSSKTYLFLDARYQQGNPEYSLLSPKNIFENGFAHELYIGFQKKYTRKYLHNVGIGLEGSRTINYKNGLLMSVKTYDSWESAVNNNPSVDYYRLKNLNLGLRLSIGL